MAITEAKARLAVCDACGSKQFCMDFEDPSGVFGQVMFVGSWGGYLVDFYSCNDMSDHIGQAIVRAREAFLHNEVVSTSTVASPTIETLVKSLESLPDEESTRTRRGAHNLNPKSDDELTQELAELCECIGGMPSRDRVQKTLHIGRRRADLVMYRVRNQ